MLSNFFERYMTDKHPRRRWQPVLFNAGLSSREETVNRGLAFDVALKGALCEGAGSAMLFRRD